MEKDMSLPSIKRVHQYFIDPNEKYILPPECGMYEYLLERNKNYMNDVGITFLNQKIKYEDIHTKIDHYARALYKKGVRKGDIIGLCVANTPESVYLSYAINKLGAVICHINPMDNSFKIMRDLEIVKPKMIITINESYRNIKTAQKKLDESIDIIVFPAVESVNSDLIKMLYQFKQIINGNFLLKADRGLKKILNNVSEFDEVEYPKYVKDELSHILFTGGSSGIHKGVDLSANALNSVLRASDFSSPLKPGDKFLGNLPQFMTFGAFSVHYALCNNADLELTIKMMPKDFIDELKRTKPVGAFGGPIHWNQLLCEKNDLSDLDLSNMKQPISGGEQLVLDKWKKINEILLEHGSQSILWNGLGATEMWGPACLNIGNPNTVGTVGWAGAYNNVKIMSEDGTTELGFNKIGKLYITGPSMMLGFHNNPEETEKVFKYDNNGTKWYDTGDLALINGLGEVKFVGRDKRCFVCGVENIYPEQIEDILSSLPEINQIIVTHIPNDKLQNVPIYHISIDNNVDKEILTDKINRCIYVTLGKSALPYEINYTYDSLPLTSNGKLDYKPLQKIDSNEVLLKKIRHLK